MTLDPQLAAQHAQSVSLYLVSSMSSGGKPTFATAVTLAARVEEHQQRVETTGGTTQTSSYRVLMAGSAQDFGDVSGACLVLPGETAKRPILLWSELPDERGAHDHCEVLV